MLRRLMEDEEYGQILYPNGDFYEGSCKNGSLQDGYGRYVWKNGNEYVGEWKNGVFWGRGVLIWSNGSRYDGFWENGVPKGNGVFTWPDGGCYVVSWNDGFKRIQHLDGGDNGLFYFDADSNITSTTTSTAPFSVDDLIITTAINRRGFPRICVWKSDGEFGDITCDIVDDFRSGSLFIPDGFRNFRRGNSCFFGSRELKRPGQMIPKGHKNYELMLNLQLGIRYSVGKCYSTLPRLRACDFDPKEKFWTRFPPEGSKYTPPHQSVEFWWKDYCPMVFRYLRKLFQVDSANYMMAICGNEALRELSSPGKSGSFFYLTQDDRFMIKTLKKSEVKVLIRMLSSYYKHVRRYSNTLVTKIFGVHCIKRVGGQKTRFIIMGNLFCSEYPIHRRFDLKGSSYGRITEKPAVEIDETTTLKDLDLNFRFRLHRSWLQEFIKQINRDCEFLEAERIMDYSLLVGLHFCDVNTCEKMGLSPFLAQFEKEETFQNENFMYGSSFLEAELQDRDGVLAGRKPLVRLGVNMPARAEKMTRSDFDQYTQGDVLHLIPRRCGETYDVVLYFGIIDILQDYDIIKKLEHAYKSLQADPASISAVDPKLYSKRFRDFISRIFIED